MVKVDLLKQFGLTVCTKLCCKGCYVKIDRATSNYQLAVSDAPLTEVPENSLPTKGRPRVIFEKSSTKTQEKVYKQARRMLDESL